MISSSIQTFYLGLLAGCMWSLVTECSTFEIIIPSYNNEKWCIDNLRSAVNQKHHDFHITYIDDCSTDFTGMLIDSFVEQKNLQDKVTVIHNKQRRGALANLYHAIHGCPDATVVVTLDGDDFLAHDQVLERLEKEYSKKNVWLTYGQFLYWPNKADNHFCKAFPAKIVASNAFRSYKHVGASHLRTFYAGLFKLIKADDLMDEGDFYTMTWDLAFMLPMLEMAQERHAFISDILYLYNNTNSISDVRVDAGLQSRIDKQIRSKKRYGRLDKLPNLESDLHFVEACTSLSSNFKNHPTKGPHAKKRFIRR